MVSTALCSQNFPKSKHFLSLDTQRTRTCAYRGVRNFCFSENFGNVLNVQNYGMKIQKHNCIESLCNQNVMKPVCI